MSYKIIGKVHPYYIGEYDKTKAYSYMERVLYNNNVYEALKTVPMGIPPTSTSYWYMLQDKGLKGDKGTVGDLPDHSWLDTTLYFQNTGGELDGGTNLKGLKGVKGETGDEGDQVELSDAINSTDTTKVASSYALNVAYDYATNKETPISDAIDGESSTTGASSKAIKIAIAQKSGDFFLIGSIMPFYGSFGGTDNRYPIPLGETDPDTNWVMCDGITTNGIEVPDLRDRFIKGGNGSNQKVIGGANYHTHTVGATDATTISVEQLPAHTHEIVAGYHNKVNSGRSYYAQTTKATKTTDSGTYASGSHSHAASTAAGHHSYPPCYTMYFIMKIA